MAIEITEDDLDSNPTLPPRVLWQRGEERIELRYVLGLPVLVLLWRGARMGAWCVAKRARD